MNAGAFQKSRARAGLRLGTRARLRAADALYAATAALRTKGRLVSRDQELIDRAGAVTPADWLDNRR